MNFYELVEFFWHDLQGTCSDRSANFLGIPRISSDESMNFLGNPRVFLTILWICSDMSTNFLGIPGISCDESMNFLGFPRIFLTTLWFCSVRSTDFLEIPGISSDKSMNFLGIPRISSDSEREGCWNSQEFFEDRRREGIQVNCSRTWASWFLSFSLALGPLPFSCLSSVLSLSWLGRVCPGGLFKRPPSGLVSQSVSQKQEKAMLHCDLRVRWKVASDLRFRAAISGPEPLFSAGFLAIWLRQRGNH